MAAVAAVAATAMRESVTGTPRTTGKSFVSVAAAALAGGVAVAAAALAGDVAVAAVVVVAVVVVAVVVVVAAADDDDDVGGFPQTSSVRAAAVRGSSRSASDHERGSTSVAAAVSAFGFPTEAFSEGGDETECPREPEEDREEDLPPAMAVPAPAFRPEALVGGGDGEYFPRVFDERGGDGDFEGAGSG